MKPFREIPPRRLALYSGGGAALLVACWLAFGAGGGTDQASFAQVKMGDLVLESEISGILEAVDAASLGPPPVPSIRQFQISMMAPEGEPVKAGTTVLSFDASLLKRQLEQKLAERDTALKEISKKEMEQALERRNDALSLAEGEASLRKAKLNLEAPPELERANVLDEARLELERAEKSAASLRERMAYKASASGAEMGVLKTKAARVAAKVRELETSIESMNVKAPRDGIVIYFSDWQGEKKKVGDSCWRGEKVIEIPDLKKMVGKGELDEADAGKIRGGQPAKIKLDAHPDVDFPAKVQSIQQTVQQKAWNNPAKVVRLTLDLLRIDSQRMRPGMRFRGKVETGKISGSTLVPVEAVFPTPKGPVVFKRGFTGPKEKPVVTGERNEKFVQVISGLRAGDWVSLNNPKKEGEGDRK